MPAFKGKFEYVIVGGGNAAGYAAKEYIAKGGPQGELLIITSEPVRQPACLLNRGTVQPSCRSLPGLRRVFFLR